MARGRTRNRMELRAQAEAAERLEQGEGEEKDEEEEEEGDEAEEAEEGGEEAKKAEGEAGRLKKLIARSPFLGVTLAGESMLIREVAPDGPAARAGGISKSSKIT